MRVLQVELYIINILIKMYHPKQICFLTLILLSCFAHSQKNKDLNIIYIGNSITQGALLEDPELNSPPAQSTKILIDGNVFKSVSFSNQGVSGSTSVDFLPLTNTLFTKVKEAANRFYQDKNAILLFSIMLGTNDSASNGANGAPVSSRQYSTNLKAIIDELIYLYPKALFVIHKPLWYSPNTYNYAMYLEAGQKRLQSYFPEIENLVELYAQRRPNQVYLGDKDASDYLEANYEDLFIAEKGNAGIFYLHPNKAGAQVLANFWSRAF